MLVASLAVVPTQTADAATAGSAVTGTVDADGPRWRLHPIDLTDGQIVSVTLDWTGSANLNLFLRDPEGNGRARSSSTVANTEVITFTIDQTGTWGIGVKAVSESATYTVTTDLLDGLNEAPTVQIASPAVDGEIFDGSPANLAGTYIDDNLVDAVQIALRDQESGLWWDAISTTWGSFTWFDATIMGGPTDGTFSYTFAPPANGRFWFMARAVDDVGSYSTRSGRGFEITNIGGGSDITPPATTITSPNEGADLMAPVTVTGTASDNVAVQQVQVAVKHRDLGQWYDPTTQTLGSFMWFEATLDNLGSVTNWSVPLNLPAGSYFIQARAVDQAGLVDPDRTSARFSVSEPVASGPPSFTDVTASAGIDAIGPSWGASWSDVTGDGLPELFLQRHQGQLRLYINNADGTFTDEGSTLIVADTWDGHGGVFADYDDDGDIDVFMSADSGVQVEGAPSRLFENLDGSGTSWAEIGMAAGVDTPRSRGRMSMWLDMGNDGDLDLVVVSKRRSNDPVDDPDLDTLVYDQGAPGQFSKTSLTDELVHNFVAMADTRLDGPPQLFVPVFLQPWPTKVFDHRCATPLDVSATLDLPTDQALAVAIGDFDGNLVSDLFFTRGEPLNGFNQTAPNVVEGRLAGGTRGVDIETTGELSVKFGPSYKFNLFSTELAVGSAGTIVSNPGQLQVLDPANPDHQGLPADLGTDPRVFVGYNTSTGVWQIRYVTLPSSLNTVATSSTPVTGLETYGLPPLSPYVEGLWLNDGAGSYVDRSHQITTSRPSYGRSALAGDFDNDGDLDVYISGAETTTNRQNTLLVNDGVGNFTEVPGSGGAGGTETLGRGDGAATADYDGDGFLDIAVANGKADPPFDQDGPTQLFLNNGNSNHWIQIDLEGSHGNAHGIGAVVRVTADGKTQHRVQDGGIHYRGQNGHRVHVGLGSSSVIDEIEVRWPSGLISTLTDVPVDQILTVTEPTATPPIVGCND